MKKPTGSVRFQFYKPETEKTEPNPNRKNQKKTESNWKKTEPKSSQTEKPSQTGKPNPNRFLSKKKNWNQSVWTGFGFFKKIRFGYFFFIKTEPNWKWSSLLSMLPLNNFFILVLSSNFKNHQLRIYIHF